MTNTQKSLADMTPAEYEQHKREIQREAVRKRAAPYGSANKLTDEQWRAEKRRLGIR